MTTDLTPQRREVKQCRTCPWRADADTSEIPGYDIDLHRGLEGTIRSGVESLCGSRRRVMACHYSQPGEEFPCAGWLANQIGPGNNIGVRMAVACGRLPAPVVDGPQCETFEETIRG